MPRGTSQDDRLPSIFFASLQGGSSSPVSLGQIERTTIDSHQLCHFSFCRFLPSEPSDTLAWRICFYLFILPSRDVMMVPTGELRGDSRQAQVPLLSRWRIYPLRLWPPEYFNSPVRTSKHVQHVDKYKTHPCLSPSPGSRATRPFLFFSFLFLVFSPLRASVSLPCCLYLEHNMHDYPPARRETGPIECGESVPGRRRTRARGCAPVRECRQSPATRGRPAAYQ